MIAHLLGAPVADHHRWAEWSDEVVQDTYPTKYRTERGVGLEGAHPEFTAYVDEQIRVRRDAAEHAQRLHARIVRQRRVEEGMMFGRNFDPRHGAGVYL